MCTDDIEETACVCYRYSENCRLQRTLHLGHCRQVFMKEIPPRTPFQPHSSSMSVRDAVVITIYYAQMCPAYKYISYSSHNSEICLFSQLEYIGLYLTAEKLPPSPFLAMPLKIFFLRGAAISCYSRELTSAPQRQHEYAIVSKAPCINMNEGESSAPSSDRFTRHFHLR